MADQYILTANDQVQGFCGSCGGSQLVYLMFSDGDATLACCRCQRILKRVVFAVPPQPESLTKYASGLQLDDED